MWECKEYKEYEIEIVCNKIQNYNLRIHTLSMENIAAVMDQ
jgi:hypothetical protein